MELVQILAVIQSGSASHALQLLLTGHGLFGVSFVFVLKFFGMLGIFFGISIIISKLLKLDKTYDELHQDKKGTIPLMLVVSIPEPSSFSATGNSGYLIGGIIALFILGYLVYTLIRPDKF
jgi:K+-transporting ATPase KdpF subunit